MLVAAEKFSDFKKITRTQRLQPPFISPTPPGLFTYICFCFNENLTTLQRHLNDILNNSESCLCRMHENNFRPTARHRLLHRHDYFNESSLISSYCNREHSISASVPWFYDPFMHVHRHHLLQR